MIKFTICFFILFISLACDRVSKKTVEEETEPIRVDSIAPTISADSKENKPLYTLQEVNINNNELVEYAKTLIGVPYLYASTNPANGFDCSGFITYVFNHFNVAVPRSSKDFTNVGLEVDIPAAKEGDLILFTGTNDSIRIVGHMGIVTENSDTLKFIHSTSGKAKGVVISALNEHYMKRFVKITRVLLEK